MLPLAEGYSTTFRNFDVQTQKVKLLQLTVAGKEEITVPVGKFDTLSGRDFLRGWRLGQEDRLDSYGNPQSSEGHPGRGFYGRSGDDSGTGAVDKVSDVWHQQYCSGAVGGNQTDGELKTPRSPRTERPIVARPLANGSSDTADDEDAGRGFVSTLPSPPERPSPTADPVPAV